MKCLAFEPRRSRLLCGGTMSNETQELVSKIEKLLRHKYGATSMSAQQRLFQSHDKDSDGKIDSDELCALLKEADVGNRITRGAWVRGVMRHMDTDGDGKISWEEYRHAIDNA
jgi:Ca2+-binding EF-hand superfamily protein